MIFGLIVTLKINFVNKSWNKSNSANWREW